MVRLNSFSSLRDISAVNDKVTIMFRAGEKWIFAIRISTLFLLTHLRWMARVKLEIFHVDYPPDTRRTISPTFLHLSHPPPLRRRFLYLTLLSDITSAIDTLYLCQECRRVGSVVKNESRYSLPREILFPLFYRSYPLSLPFPVKTWIPHRLLVSRKNVTAWRRFSSASYTHRVRLAKKSLLHRFCAREKLSDGWNHGKK